MTSTRINLLLVGSVVLAALTSLVVVVAVLAGRGGATDTYYTEYSNVSGLKFGSQVFYEGYPVGEVEQIEPVTRDGHLHFRVRMSIVSGWKIPRDSKARSVMTSFLAPQTIAISAGTSGAVLQPGDVIVSGGPGGLMESLSTTATTVGDFTQQSLQPLAANLNREVALIGEIIDQQVRPLVGSANIIMAAAADHVPNILERVDSASGNFAAASGRVNALLSPERLRAVDRMVANADATAQNLEASSGQLRGLLAEGGDLRTSVADLHSSMATFAGRADVVAENLATASRNFADFSRRIRGNPGLLLRGARNGLDEAAPDPSGVAP